MKILSTSESVRIRDRRAVIGAIAGHVSKGMNRGDLKDLGERLDEGETGLVVVAAADVSSKVEEALSSAENVISKELKASEAELDTDVQEAQSDDAG